MEVWAGAWPLEGGVEAFWQGLADKVRTWLAEQGVAPQEAVLLLPFVQQLPLARRAFGAGWAPRIETTRSLASALGPSPLARASEPSGDLATDSLLARQLLTQQGLSPAEMPGGERGLRLLCARVVELTHALMRRATELAPHEREAWWQTAQGLLQQRADQAPAWEGLLGNLALAWAQTAAAPATDRLFAHRAKAWILVEAGEPDLLARAVLKQSAVPSLLLSADDAPAPWLTLAKGRVQEDLAEDAQDLALRCAMQVLQAVPGERVALIALDRSLVRRVLALLQPYGLRIHDETGATLSAQSAAAALMHLLRAVLGGGLDDLLAWLKSPLAPQFIEAKALGELEGWARRQSVAQWRGVRSAPAPAQALLDGLRPRLERLGGGARSLGLWLQGLRDLLEQCGLEERLRTEPELLALGEALWLTRKPWPGSATEAVLQGVRIEAGDWLDWVDERLRTSATPSLVVADPQLFITPLSRALLRPFDRVLLAGCDAQSMALGRVAPALLSDSLAQRLGLAHHERAQAAQWQAFCQLLRAPAVCLLRARTAGSVHLEPGWPLRRLVALVGPLSGAADARSMQRLPEAPLVQAQVGLSGWLPEHWSAAAAETLRACPYRFFAQRRLRLREADELDEDADARDLGQGLHALLAALHEQPISSMEEGGARWQACAQALLQQQDDAQALGLAALLERWRVPYLAWWLGQVQAGQAVLEREWPVEAPVWADHADPALAALVWQGRIDRIDRVGAIDAGQRLLLDFKTGSASALRDKLKQAGEDTQLPFYAALLQAMGQPVSSASYIALDTKGQVNELSHPDLQTSAEQLREGLAADLLAIRAGQPLRALGEEAVCGFCEMRGLCRRDDWSAQP
ncbi:ATP-dependent helicase/nuclease subunit B [Inhella inkyongensis]|uniref:ATP-dependent helicase/nuclease subunit B n=1 Tax=Inhella inkyongensis TaxID=392593 RepID=A0A840S6R8_9BURK|nr:PD-(D/E)XK nuclease family protein [Inhella inkyongensis]MBB5204159.1 ATP-dependent helicase/nuclease subunit B [Inhella inkyongensis]